MDHMQVYFLIMGMSRNAGKQGNNIDTDFQLRNNLLSQLDQSLT